jgi:hypothetical protein
MSMFYSFAQHIMFHYIYIRVVGRNAVSLLDTRPVAGCQELL